jgi:hypothetical protein
MAITFKDLFIKLLKLTNPLSLLPGILIFLYVTIVMFKYTMLTALLYTIVFVSFSHLGSIINLSALIIKKVSKIKEKDIYLCYSNTNFFIIHYFFLTLEGEMIIRYDMSASDREIARNIDRNILTKTSAKIYNKDYAIIKLR